MKIIHIKKDEKKLELDNMHIFIYIIYIFS